MTRTGQAVVTVGKEFSIGEYTVPDPATGTVLLRQELGGICGTDLHNWQKGIERATMLGHENVGVIEALGKGVTTDYNGTPIREGDRVVFHPRNTVMASGHGGAGRALQRRVRRLHLSVRSGVVHNQVGGAAAGGRSGRAVYDRRACRVAGQSQNRRHSHCSGAGPIGMMCLIAARISGASQLIVIGGPAGRLELARKLGAHETVDIMAVPRSG